MGRVKLTRLFWIGAAVVLAAAALVAIVAVLRGGFSDTDGKILGTLAALLACSGTVIAGLALVERRRLVALGWTALPVAAIAFVLLEVAMWSETDSDTLGRATTTAWLVLAAVVLATTALLLARRATLVRVALVASLLVAAAAGATIAAIWSGDDPSDTALKAIATLWILAVLAWFLVPVLSRLLAAPPEPGVDRVLAAEGDVELVATRAPGGRGIDPRLEPGERLVLRRR